MGLTNLFKKCFLFALWTVLDCAIMFHISSFKSSVNLWMCYHTTFLFFIFGCKINDCNAGVCLCPFLFSRTSTISRMTVYVWCLPPCQTSKSSTLSVTSIKKDWSVWGSSMRSSLTLMRSKWYLVSYHVFSTFIWCNFSSVIPSIDKSVNIVILWFLGTWTCDPCYMCRHWHQADIEHLYTFVGSERCRCSLSENPGSHFAHFLHCYLQLLSKPKFSGVEKIKTIGSTYMAAAGLSGPPEQTKQV